MEQIALSLDNVANAIYKLAAVIGTYGFLFLLFKSMGSSDYSGAINSIVQSINKIESFISDLKNKKG